MTSFRSGVLAGLVSAALVRPEAAQPSAPDIDLTAFANGALVESSSSDYGGGWEARWLTDESAETGWCNADGAKGPFSIVISLPDRSELHAAQQRVEVDTTHECVDVDPRQKCIDVDAVEQGIDVHLPEDRVDVDLREDGVEVDCSIPEELPPYNRLVLGTPIGKTVPIEYRRGDSSQSAQVTTVGRETAQGILVAAR